MVVSDLLIVLHSYQSLDKLGKNLDGDDFIILKKDFPDNWKNLSKKISTPIPIFQ